MQAAGRYQTEKEKEKGEEQCRQYFSEFLQCADEKTVFRSWRCRKQYKEYKKCLHQYNNDTVFEKMKKEYMGPGQGK